MIHDEEAVEVAEKYADSCSPNDKRPTIGSTYSLEISLRSLWEAERNSFLAGVKWERERIREKLREIKEIVDEELCAPSYKIQIDNNGYKTVTNMAEQEIRDSAHKVAVAIASLLGEK